MISDKNFEWSRAGGGGRVLMIARKRARQSKYVERKGKVVMVLDGRSTVLP